MNKKIITIAEVVFALIFVILLALFMSTIITKGNSTNTQLIDTLETTGGTSLAAYDGTYMKGEAVISAIRNVKSLNDGDKVQIDVYLSKNNTLDTKDANRKTDGTSTGTGNAYGYLGASGSTPVSYKNPGSEETTYINPAADFYSNLIYNANNIVVGIQFSQINAADGLPCVNPTDRGGNGNDAGRLLTASPTKCGAGAANMITAYTKK